MEKISGVVLSKNNEKEIARCLRSMLGLIDELILVDDYSSDQTVEIASDIFPELKVIKSKLERFDEQRNLGIKEAKNDWILMIDTDEELSSELRESILNLEFKDNIEAYWVKRLNSFFKTFLKEKHRHRPILFKSNLKFVKPVHEIIEIDDNKVQFLLGDLIHYNWKGIEVAMEKMNKYSSLVADRWIEEGRNYNKLTLFVFALILPVRYTFICYFKKGFYKIGLIRGWFYAMLESSWWLATIFKYQENKNNLKNK